MSASHCYRGGRLGPCLFSSPARMVQMYLNKLWNPQATQVRLGWKMWSPNSSWGRKKTHNKTKSGSPKQWCLVQNEVWSGGRDWGLSQISHHFLWNQIRCGGPAGHFRLIWDRAEWPLMGATWGTCSHRAGDLSSAVKLVACWNWSDLVLELVWPCAGTCGKDSSSHPPQAPRAFQHSFDFHLISQRSSSE